MPIFIIIIKIIFQILILLLKYICYSYGIDYLSPLIILIVMYVEFKIIKYLIKKHKKSLE